jgi:hypothetical protein
MVTELLVIITVVVALRSNLGWDTSYFDSSFRGFSPSLQEHSGIVVLLLDHGHFLSKPHQFIIPAFLR